MKEGLQIGFEPYTKPKAEVFTLPDRLNFLNRGFSARFLDEDDPLDWEYWEGHELDIF